MKNLLKLKVFILVLSIIFAPQAVAAERILPIPKPIVDEESKKKTAKKKEIYPKKKPGEETEKVEVEEFKEVGEKLEKSIIIYPQKKPIIIKKQVVKAAIKSQILSKSDYKIAKSAFEAVDKKKWQTAIKLSKKAKDKMVFKTVYWLYLIQASNNASFYDYLTFINFDPFSTSPFNT